MGKVHPVLGDKWSEMLLVWKEMEQRELPRRAGSWVSGRMCAKILKSF